MARSAWKGPFVDSHLLKKAEIDREKGSKEVIKKRRKKVSATTRRKRRRNI